MGGGGRVYKTGGVLKGIIAHTNGIFLDTSLVWNVNGLFAPTPLRTGGRGVGRRHG